ncbi:MAG: DUF58 domain-containing protein [Pirellulales bacterium]
MTVTPDQSSTRTTTTDGGSIRSGSRWVDTEALMRIKSLELRARMAMDGYVRGLHRSVRHGFSVEFSEYRNYVMGDDPRYMDWKVFARTDRYYVRRFEDETNLRCMFVLDVSRSMDFGSGSYTKADYARTLIATLSYYLTLRRDAVGLITTDEQHREMLPSRYRPGHWRRLLMTLERTSQTPHTNLVAPLDEVARLVPPRTTVVVVSDFLTPLEQLARPLSLLAARRQSVQLFWVLDPAERDLSLGKAAQYEDMETGERVYVRPDLQREAYQRRLAEHEAALRNLADTRGIALHAVSTAHPLDGVLMEFVNRFGNYGGARGTRTRGAR